MEIKDRIDISNRFQASVNLEFDLHKTTKILEYVPTTGICEILSLYVDSLLKNERPSSFLIGPYGKGKSFLALTVLQFAGHLISEKVANEFIEKTEKINPILANNLRTLWKRPPFLPVIVNADYNDLKQSFMVALRSSVETAGLSDLLPRSTFDDCHRILNSWLSDSVFLQGALAKCRSQFGISEPDLKKIDDGLLSYSSAAYRKFVQLYNCVSVGQKYNPLISDDVPQLFADIAFEIKKKGFSGIIVVFDEFSKFLNNQSKSLNSELNFVQSFAEKANRSDENYSLFFCCITHKPITQYSQQNEKTQDALKTVEGRFTLYQFGHQKKDDVDLISSAIIKKDGFPVFYREFKKQHHDLLEEIRRLNLVDGKTDYDAFVEGCYPLNPITAYCLGEISERVGQNERTIFTFLSGSDVNSLRRLVNRSDREMIDLTSVYDYFKEQFDSNGDQDLKNVHFLAKSALEKCEKNADEKGTKVLKAMAIILMINDVNHIRSDRNTIALSLGKSLASLSPTIERLIKMGLVREGANDRCLHFAFVGSKEINDKADLLLSKELLKLDPLSTLNELTSTDYFLPNAYNIDHRITRYCRYYYLAYDVFLELQSFQHLSVGPCDVLIVRLLGDQIDSKAVQKHVREIGAQNVVVETPCIYPHEGLIRNLRYEAAYERMATSDPEDETLLLIKENSQREIKGIISSAFRPDCLTAFYCVPLKERNIAKIIDEICSTYYSKSPIINNELLNRNLPTAQYRKPRNDLINFVLSNGIDRARWQRTYPSSTSVQNTIWRVFIDYVDEEPAKHGIRPVIDLIKQEINQSGKIKIRDIVKQLMDAPFGIRLGVVPLFLTVAISELNRMNDSSATLFFRSKEIDLTAENIEKAVEDTQEDYGLKIDSGAAQKGKFLEGIIQLFGGHAEPQALGNVQLAFNLMRMWYRNLPKITRGATVFEYPIAMNKTKELLLAALGKYDVNPSDFLFNGLLKILKCSDFDETYQKLNKMKIEIESLPDEILKSEFVDLWQQLGLDKGSLLPGFRSFLQRLNYQPGEMKIGTENYIELADYFYASRSYDDATVIRESSRILLRIYFEDWSSGYKNKLIDKLKEWMDYMKSASQDDTRSDYDSILKLAESVPTKRALSPLTRNLESSLRGTIDQFGSSLSDSDIIYVLTNILKNPRGSK